jgi:broad specificity phosphatase PhoE
MAMRRVILARHGESEFSVRGALNGDISVPCGLTPAGIDQAHLLGEALRGEPIELCVTSEFERAHATADEALEGRDVPRLVLPELNDPLYGPYEGAQIDEFRAWAGSASSAESPGPGGESRFAIVERYARAFRLLLDRPEATVLAVAHSLPIAYALGARAGDAPSARTPLADYATPYPFERDELDRATAVLERWLAAPTW